MQEVKLLTNPFPDYSLIDSGEGYRLEKFGDFIVSKPDPQAIWKKKTNKWKEANLEYLKENGGYWEKNGNVPESWNIKWNNLNFVVRPTPFKHLGIFPEQSANWEWLSDLIQDQKREVKVLNLFGYTGAASIVAASLGAVVTHVDASKNSISWVKENLIASKLGEDAIRVICDDCLKFVRREYNRGNKYDIILADPPAFGHGTKNEVWKFNEHFPHLMDNIGKILSDRPIAVMVNAYAQSASSIMLANVFEDYLPQGKITFGELCINEETGRLFSTGIFAKWENTSTY